ncbi:MAG TPA: NifB/NifX family molybdenum-iron cluster-binding protein [Oscillospiraceae bacterium]|nr:NifB/NifX family molybdenum-iron cluster-binding protein [Oscillospiraceae bacterium]
MKIAIPVDEKDLKTNVCVSFGRAPYFLVYDTDTDKSVFIENKAAVSAGGAGIKAAQAIVDSGANVLLAPRCGENAANVILESGIKIFKTEFSLAKENIDAFIGDKLSELDEIHSGYHGIGSN